MSSDSKPTLAEIKSSINNIKIIIKNIEIKGISSPVDKENYFWDNYPEMMNRFPFLSFSNTRSIKSIWSVFFSFLKMLFY